MKSLNSILAASLIVVCCSNDSFKKENELIQPFLGSSSSPIVLIIPVEGCTSCANEGLLFAARNIENPDFKFILSDIRSEKSTRIKVGEVLLQNKNVVVDTLNVLSTHGLVGYTTTIVLMANHKVHSLEKTTGENMSAKLAALISKK